MRYENIKKGVFVDRPNRFIAHVEIDGRRETVHVKNTGRCKELLRAGTSVYAEECGNPGRKTKWDLIAVEKGERMVNIDSQAPNKLVKEWLEKGNLFKNIICIKPEFTYGNSRIDLYVEADGKKILIEVKGVTLEENNVVRFPDAPSERAVKHVEELMRAAADGFEAYVFFVVQLEGADKFMPNMDTHPEFGEALRKARHAGVKAVAYDCAVAADSIEIRSEVPVVLEDSGFRELAEPLIAWYRQNKRDLPWRATADPYRIWVSEIMLQQTRVEAVKPYYERFLSELPGVRELADVPEERLLKLWEGLGYYNRARNMQKAARQIVEDYGGRFPVTYEEIRSLKGIGNYTAGAIASFAYGILKPAVDGNVLRVARESHSIWSILYRSLPAILAAVCAILALCVFLSRYLTASLVAPIGRLVEDMDHMDHIGEKEIYVELLPFAKTIRTQHDAIVRNANMRQEFSANVSHELKTPLTACSLILANQGPLCRGQVCQVADRCAREIRRADNLTEDILYYARLRSADRDIRAVRFSAGRLLEEAVKRQMEILIAAGIRVELTGDFMAYGDEKSLSYMVQQLLVNAAKYCPGCRILLQAEGNRIVVEDDGIGVPSHEVERITDRGFTGTNGEKFPNSTGMGLYVVKRLCEKLGIGFTVESEAGRYTRFTFSL